ncbi:MAG: redoxin domain-containing protein [Planctomycetota bacterium]|jgi:hypothetical protein
MKSTITLSLTICAAALVAATVAAGEEPTMAKLGEPVPDFTLVDAAGVKRSLSDYKGKLVVLEWINPQCPFVQGCYKTKAMQKAYEKVKVLDKGVAWLQAVRAGVPDPARFRRRRGPPLRCAQDAPHVRHRQGRHPALPRGDR